jgi:hypothetical protein
LKKLTGLVVGSLVAASLFAVAAPAEAAKLPNAKSVAQRIGCTDDVSKVKRPKRNRPTVMWRSKVHCWSVPAVDAYYGTEYLTVTEYGSKKKLRVQLRYMKRLLSQHNLCLTIGVGKHYIVADAGGGDLPVDAYLFLSDRGVRLKTVC